MKEPANTHGNFSPGEIQPVYPTILLNKTTTRKDTKILIAWIGGDGAGRKYLANMACIGSFEINREMKQKIKNKIYQPWEN